MNVGGGDGGHVSEEAAIPRCVGAGLYCCKTSPRRQWAELPVAVVSGSGGFGFSPDVVTSCASFLKS